MVAPAVLVPLCACVQPEHVLSDGQHHPFSSHSWTSGQSAGTQQLLSALQCVELNGTQNRKRCRRAGLHSVYEFALTGSRMLDRHV